MHPREKTFLEFCGERVNQGSMMRPDVNGESISPIEGVEVLILMKRSS